MKLVTEENSRLFLSFCNQEINSSLKSCLLCYVFSFQDSTKGGFENVWNSHQVMRQGSKIYSGKKISVIYENRVEQSFESRFVVVPIVQKQELQVLPYDILAKILR